VRNNGFSLIEVTMALLILGMVAGAVALRVEPILNRERTEQVMDDIVRFDRLTRTLARRTDKRLIMVFDTSGRQLRRLDATGSELPGRTLMLPENYSVTRVLVRSQNVGTGMISIPCSRRGFTPTYAIRLEAPGPVRRWILLAALGGREVIINEADDHRITEILAYTTRRRNAD